MNLAKLFLILFAAACLFTNCKEEPGSTATAMATSEVALKTTYADDFFIGAAISGRQINGANPKAMEVLLREFNSITAENNMKWMYIHPEEATFNFETADKFVELGESHNMQVVGHTLVWHSQLANWMKQIDNKEEMARQLDKHIETIVSRYKGRVDGWDVVNEALNEDGSLRESVFLKVMGEAYLLRAFQKAAEVDPEAELYYNDYNLCQPAKRAGCIRMIKSLQEQGAKIDGIGIQAHWKLDRPSIEEIEKSILEYSALGLKVMFTELDLSVLPNPWDLQGADVDQNFENSPFMNPYTEALPDSVALAQAERYADIFGLFLKHRDKITRVTFWGIHDGQSWLNNWPIRGRTNYPLLFDRNFEKKQAYEGVVGVKRGKP